MNDDTANILMNYGHCTAEKCECAASGIWRGITCDLWKPVQARTYAELIAEARRIYGEKHEPDTAAGR